MPSDNVEAGTALVSEDVNYLCSDNRARNKNIKIEVKNIYYNDELNVKIANTYTKKSLKNLTGYTDYDTYNGAVFINTNDYISLFDKDPYQSSVFVKDEEKIEDTINRLKELGINARSIEEFKVNDSEEEL
jgi:hypothetical protein